MERRHFRNLNESSTSEKAEVGMSFTEAIEYLDAYQKPVGLKSRKAKKLGEAKSNRKHVFEVVYSDGHAEEAYGHEVAELIDELEAFDRDDVLHINLLKPDGDFDTIWTEEEGLFVSQGKLANLLREGADMFVCEKPAKKLGEANNNESSDQVKRASVDPVSRALENDCSVYDYIGEGLKKTIPELERLHIPTDRRTLHGIMDMIVDLWLDNEESGSNDADGTLRSLRK